MRNNFNTLSSQEEVSTSYKKKIAAATLAVTGLFSVGCSSEGSASGGGFSSPFSNSREVIAGEECSSRTDIHNIGTFSPAEFDADRFQPFPEGTVDPRGVALRDGLASESQAPRGTLVDIETLPDVQKEQLGDSYKMMVEQITPEDGDWVKPSYQNGFIVLYGEDLTDDFRQLSENEWRYTDGVVDSEDLQVCVFARNGQGDVSKDQFIR